MAGWMDGWMIGSVVIWECASIKWMDGWKDGWMDGWKDDVWMDETYMDGRMD